LIAQGWASGISVWGVIVATGISDRVGWIDAPGYLASPLVLLAATVLLLIEIFADKVAYVDSASDAVQTMVRPVVGAVIAAQWGSAEDQISTELAALLGGTSTAVSHLTKTGLRAAVNLSPEPFSNVAISATEDALALTVIGLAFSHPWAALTIALSALAAMLILIVVAVLVARRAYRAMKNRRDGVPPDEPRSRLQRWMLGEP
jgi:predicted permease